MRRIILYGLAGGLIAAIFAGVGMWFGMGCAGVMRRRGTEATAGVA